MAGENAMRKNSRCSRREFLSGVSALGAVCAVGQSCQPRTDFSENPLADDLVLVLAGLPKAGERLAAAKTYLDSLVAAVLKMRPQPARCLIIGGLPDELSDVFRPWRKSGMGVFSDFGRVTVPLADFLLVEGMDVSALSQAPSEGDRPLFVCADFAPNGALASAALRLPNIVGLFDGYGHRWRSSIVPRTGHDVRMLSLPSAGGSGDVGYVLLRLTSTNATAELHQDGFLPPSASSADPHPADWSSVVAANQGARCRFVWG